MRDRYQSIASNCAMNIVDHVPTSMCGAVNQVACIPIMGYTGQTYQLMVVFLVMQLERIGGRISLSELGDQWF